MGRLWGPSLVVEVCVYNVRGGLADELNMEVKKPAGVVICRLL